MDGYVDRAGTVHGLVARTRDLVVHGESQITTTLPDPAWLARLTPIVEKLGLYGPLVLQAMLYRRWRPADYRVQLPLRGRLHAGHRGGG